MTKINAKLILASKNSLTGDVLYTFVLTYPRMILAEVNTHRMFSRNTSSSRAIPTKKLRDKAINDCFTPNHIGANKAGMQAGEELQGWRRTVAELVWKSSSKIAVLHHWVMDKLGVHKQITNRLIEPYMWTEQLVTATDFVNFLKLRNHAAAEPHLHELARQVDVEIERAKVILSGLTSWNSRLVDGDSTYQLILPGGVHLPFITDEETSLYGKEKLKRLSVARCARVSYFLPESGKKSSLERDAQLHNQLAESGHWSPFEHQATACGEGYFGNFKGWLQYRKEFFMEDGGDRTKE